MALNIDTPSATISASTTSARAAYPVPNTQFVRVLNDGAGIAFVASGDSTVTATTSNMFIHGNKSTIFEKNVNDTHMAVILATGTGNVYFAACSADELVGF